jgi:hypothetical protein
MADFNNNGDRNRTPKPNNNIYWIYVVVLAFFILGMLFLNSQTGVKEITLKEFEEIGRAHV